MLPVWNILNVNYDYDPTVFVNYTRERLDTVIVSRITVMGLYLINNHCILIREETRDRDSEDYNRWLGTVLIHKSLIRICI